jgi:hypothetical protein
MFINNIMGRGARGGLCTYDVIISRSVLGLLSYDVIEREGKLRFVVT